MIEELQQAFLEPNRILAWFGRLALVVLASMVVYRLIQLWKHNNLKDGVETRSESWPRRIVLWAWLLSSLVVGLAISAFSLRVTSWELLYELGETISTYFSGRIASVIGILAAGWLAYWVIGTVAGWITPGQEFSRTSVRIQSLRSIVLSAMRFVIVVTTIAATLAELGVNISALLAGASVAGLAISFGAQSLVRDILAGFFILLEDQYGVGDVVRVNGRDGLSGEVEETSLRTTVLRDLEGTVHVIPNGEIKTVSVLSKDWARAVVDVDVSYQSKLEDALELLRSTALALHADPNWEHHFLEEPEILGVQRFNTHGITLRTLMRVQPKSQWDVSREFLRRIKNAFDQASIEVALPQMRLNLEGAKQNPMPNTPE